MITPSKALSLELKGDQYRQKKKFKKALDSYKKALDLDESRSEIYDKLIAVHQELAKDWDESDFAYSVHLSMKKQEILDPTFKRLHARHEPEAKAIQKLIKKILIEKNPDTETKYVEEIVAYGPKALYPLIDFILGFKNLGKITKE